MKVIGKNACEQALRSGYNISKIFAIKNLDENYLNKITNYVKAQKLTINFVDKSVLDKMTEQKHQGIIIEINNYQYYSADDLFSFCKQKNNPFFLILDEIADPHNLGSILRTAECANLDGVIISKNRSCEVNETVVKTSVGACFSVKVFKVNNINDVIREFKKINIYCYALEADGKEIYSENLTGALCLVAGSEGFGVGRLTKTLCDGILSLPLYGSVNSLNASNATAVAIYEALRQRKD